MNQRILTLTAIGALVAGVALTGCSKTDRQTTGGATTGTTSGTNTTMGEKVDDAMITASVKTELAKDTTLSAMAINVDTANGRVALKGTAPTSAAKDQATTLAQSVKGVASVDNQLTIKP